jgi:hypothetical protein
MKVKPFKQQQVNDPKLSTLVSSIREWSEQFQNIPILNGRLIENLDITTDSLRISHGLKRVPVGWFLATKDGNVNIWETARDSNTLTLDSNGSARISIWIF